MQQVANIFSIAIASLGLILVPLSLPGTWLIVLVSIFYAIFYSYDQGQTSSYWVVAVLVFLAALGEVIEFLVGLLGSKPLKVSNGALFSAFLGGILGAILGSPILILGTLLGIFIGSFLGALTYEWIRLKEAKQAFIHALAVLASRLVASFFKSLIGLIMLIYLIMKIF